MSHSRFNTFITHSARAKPISIKMARLARLPMRSAVSAVRVTRPLQLRAYASASSSSSMTVRSSRTIFKILLNRPADAS